MKSSPIYNIVNIPGRSDRSFGAGREGFSQDIRVGTSASNSHTLAEIQVTRTDLDDGRVIFTLWIDGLHVKKGILDKKEFEMQFDALARASELMP